MPKLILCRHGQSEWNAKNLFTGWSDVKLSEQGIEEAKTAGKKVEENKKNSRDTGLLSSFYILMI